jgi:DNA mismatch endonuclease (patch repair protein)
MDTISKKKRSDVMSRIRAKNTRPEIAVRKILHRMGLRFRIHKSDLPGKPDICLPKHKAVIFVHGCFWHGHSGCSNARLPKSNRAYWIPKIKRNAERDKIHKTALRKAGWKVITVWECELKNMHRLDKRLRGFFNKPLGSRFIP